MGRGGGGDLIIVLKSSNKVAPRGVSLLELLGSYNSLAPLCSPPWTCSNIARQPGKLCADHPKWDQLSDSSGDADWSPDDVFADALQHCANLDAIAAANDAKKVRFSDDV